MSCGLTTSATVSALRAASTLRDHGDAVPLLELAGALGPLLADQQVVDAAPGPDQAGEQGLPHHSGAEDGGLHLLTPSATYFFEIRDFTKNDRFCGRSARRRIR